MIKKYFKTFIIFSGLILSIGLYFLLIFLQWKQDTAITASITLLTALWWVFEPIPIPVSSLIPLTLFPLFGVLSSAEVASSYGNPLILLLLGGFLFSQALEKNNAHKRLAFYVLKLIGQDSERKLVFGFMLASCLLSMWISNTATTLMLLPVAVAIISQAKSKSITVPLLLSMAYGASIGGMGTPIGTTPNLVFMEIYRQFSSTEVAFSQWMKWGISVIVIFIPIAFLWLTRGLKGKKTTFTLEKLPPISIAEKRVLFVFLFIILAWVFRSEPFGGWKTWINLPKANDASVAFIGVILLFLIPDKKGGALLDWKHANKIPWGILILFAGGIAIAKAFSTSGLGLILGNAISNNLPTTTFLILILVCLFVTFLTEVTSNTAATTLLMPILALVATNLNLPPALIMVPAALSASCAFMLPVATAPNAIIFTNDKINITTMIKEGFILNLIGVIIISTLCYFLI